MRIGIARLPKIGKRGFGRAGSPLPAARLKVLGAHGVTRPTYGSISAGQRQGVFDFIGDG